MYQLIEENRDELARLCPKYHVRRLALFGSATSEHFNSATSDLDFLVEFEHVPPGQHADACFGLLEGLRELFQRDIELVMTDAIRNPYFVEAVNRRRTLLYAA